MAAPRAMMRLATTVSRRSLVTAPRLCALEGTKFSERETAAETAYIRKHEAMLREMKGKNKSEIDLDKAELKELIDKAKRPHVKELLVDLHSHM